MTLRKTKIVATLGPSSNSEEMLARMIMAGVNVVRLNFSHGNAEEHINRAEMVRAIAAKLNRPIGVLCDLQGPKIRIGKFELGKVTLKTGDLFILDSDCQLGNQDHVGLDYKALPQEVAEGVILLLDDGRITMQVDRVKGNQIHCLVLNGGILSNNKGINRQGGGLSADALTKKDREDIKTAVALEADYIAMSFPKTALDVELARTLVKKAGGTASIIAKIERAEAIDNLESIIEASDAIMVARGDLGVEVGDAAVPGLQKRMIRMARVQNKLVITATQMMESMITSPIPTRAEVSDVANAVLDGTDAVMLSAETAAGQYPLETVQAVHRVVMEAEKEYYIQEHVKKLDQVFVRTDEAIAAAAIYTAQHLKVKAIAALTQSGNAAQWLSRADSEMPIYALSPDKYARRKLTLHRGVYPFPIEQGNKNKDEILQEMEQVLLQQKAVSLGDIVLLTFGEPIGSPGGTNTLKIIKVGENKQA
ncbi:pyruvate kinase [Methylotenera sp.]|uniref:pyruvate kinase n=2 Tax=Methylotenera sp. TaxID=2051956 RepID=UPI00271A9816|nr:pyruvate kinase [Methylotenera sp.]MDO9206373.1 pyruvate kinase [Methylotenera sp.]MDP1521786.1 pyruvate kinase [Methylotenera sp.]MDP2070754.1 pyruvate kinase [Methylotenera sp.]MDP2231384.1 pyruvate kinase [Methylotenera sp.]MDP3004765.1 pyruvate kinase [Methylotenera sp.]